MKLKTRKSILKRIKITKTGKLLRRPTGQDHFRVRRTGKQRRRQRKWIPVSKADTRKIKKALFF